MEWLLHDLLLYHKNICKLEKRIEMLMWTPIRRHHKKRLLQKIKNQGRTKWVHLDPWFLLCNYNIYSNKACLYLLSINKLIKYRTSSAYSTILESVLTMIPKQQRQFYHLKQKTLKQHEHLDKTLSHLAIILYYLVLSQY